MTWLLERAVGVQDVVALLRAERGRGVALVELSLDEDALALTTLQAEPDLRRLLGGQPGGSHTPAA
jgi:hypothetical protein